MACRKRKHRDIAASGIGNISTTITTTSTIDIDIAQQPPPAVDVVASSSSSPGIQHDRCDLQEEKGEAERSAVQQNEGASTYDCFRPFDCDNHHAWYHQQQGQSQGHLGNLVVNNVQHRQHHPENSNHMNPFSSPHFFYTNFPISNAYASNYPEYNTTNREHGDSTTWNTPFNGPFFLDSNANDTSAGRSPELFEFEFDIHAFAPPAPSNPRHHPVDAASGQEKTNQENWTTSRAPEFDNQEYFPGNRNENVANIFRSSPPGSYSYYGHPASYHPAAPFDQGNHMFSTRDNIQSTRTIPSRSKGASAYKKKQKKAPKARNVKGTIAANKDMKVVSSALKEEVSIDFEDLQNQAVVPPSAIPMTAELHEKDVMCGRGGKTNTFIGNLRFRQFVKSHQPKYLLCRRREKPLVAKYIVSTIRKQGGRFLKKKPNGGYSEIGDEQAIAKTLQALREGLKVRANTKKVA